jgi:hypothetical protein
MVMGMTGSWKTSLARYLLKITPRAFVFDPADDYDDGAIFYDQKTASDFYLENAERDYHLIYRGDQETFLAWLDVIYQSQRYMNLKPVGVFMEESSFYSTSHTIPKALDTIYTKGRRQRISVITVVQRDTQIHPLIRAQSPLWITMRQRKFSTDTKELFTSDELDRIPKLETFTPLLGAPIEGKHYIPDQPNFPLVESWSSLMRAENGQR